MFGYYWHFSHIFKKICRQKIYDFELCFIYCYSVQWGKFFIKNRQETYILLKVSSKVAVQFLGVVEENSFVIFNKADFLQFSLFLFCSGLLINFYWYRIFLYKKKILLGSLYAIHDLTIILRFLCDYISFGLIFCWDFADRLFCWTHERGSLFRRFDCSILF